ncbi:MAG: FAD-dependent oxidoreductase [bacterium]|nr:FAD-dependent oxidoreductase [bacterium]
MEKNIFDVIIIGGGPAGLSAALYTIRKNLKTLVISKTMGGQAAQASRVENYLGFALISGIELAKRFHEEVHRYPQELIQVVEGVEVVGMEGAFPQVTVKTGDGKAYDGQTLIIASGRVPKHLGIPGEMEFFGKGVAICATCDAPLFKGKEVVVVGGGNSALDAVYSLMNVASSVTVVNVEAELRGDEVLKTQVSQGSSIKILNNYQALEVLGEQVVTGLKVRNKIDGKERTLSAQGIFVEIGYIPSVDFDKLTKKDEVGAIVVDESGATSVSGIFAAGDVNNLWGEQMIIAAGEGAKTALTVAKFLSQNPLDKV